MQNGLQDRKMKNPSYSLRAFAKYLELAPQVLSEIFRGKRHLPVKNSQRVIDKLALSPELANEFRASLKSQKSRLKDISKLSLQSENILSEERHYRIIAQWEYYAVITLLETARPYFDIEHIAKKLDLAIDRTRFVVDVLLNEELIIQDEEGQFVKNTKKLSTTKDIPSQALRDAHIDILKIASEKIETIPVEDRFYSASTIAIKKDKLLEAKELIREFRSKLAEFTKGDGPDEVYQMNIQLFPLTVNESKKDI